jgi:hypothetical protein
MATGQPEPDRSVAGEPPDPPMRATYLRVVVVEVLVLLALWAFSSFFSG